MAIYINEVRLLGNLGADAEVRACKDSTLFKFRLCTGEEWHSVEFFARSAKAAAFLAEALNKGALIYVSGSIHTDAWTDKTGAKRQWKVVKAQEVKILPTAARDGGVIEAGVPEGWNPDVPDDDSTIGEPLEVGTPPPNPWPRAAATHQAPRAAVQAPTSAERPSLAARFRNLAK